MLGMSNQVIKYGFSQIILKLELRPIWHFEEN